MIWYKPEAMTIHMRVHQISTAIDLIKMMHQMTKLMMHSRKTLTKQIFKKKLGNNISFKL